MRKLIKVIIIISIILLVAGAGLTAFAFSRNEFKANLGNETTNIYNIEDTYENLDINTEISNIELVINNENKTIVTCDESEKIKHEVNVVDNKLVVNQNDSRKWYEKQFFNFNSNKIKVTISLPNSSYNELKIFTHVGNINIASDTFNFKDANIKSTTGNINLSNINTNVLTIESSTGNTTYNNINVLGNATITSSTGSATLSNFKSENLNINLSTGSINLTNALINNEMILTTSTGSIGLNDIDSAKLKLTTSTGSIRGSILTPKTFVTSKTTGSISVPSTTGGLCEISTSTGSINITIKNQ